MRYARHAVVVLALVVLAAVGLAQAPSVLNYFDQTTGTDNTLNIDGTLEFEDKATVLDHGTASVAAIGQKHVETNLSSVVTCTLTLLAASPGDDPVMVTGIWTTGNSGLEILVWKNTSGTDPTLAASATAASVGYICAGAD